MRIFRNIMASLGFLVSIGMVIQGLSYLGFLVEIIFNCSHAPYAMRVMGGICSLVVIFIVVGLLIAAIYSWIWEPLKKTTAPRGEEDK